MLIADIASLFDRVDVPVASRNSCVRAVLKVILGISTYRPQRESLKQEIGKEAESLLWAWVRDLQWRREYMTVYWRAFGRFVVDRDARQSEYLGVPVEDLWYMLDMLDPADLLALTATGRDPRTAPISDTAVRMVLKEIHTQLRTCAFQMRFVTSADPGCTSDDWLAHFTAEAVRGIYHYDHLPHAHLVNTVRSMLWKSLATLQKRHGSSCYANVVRNDDGSFTHMRVSMELEVDGDTVDIPSLAGHYTLQTTEDDLDAAKMLAAVEYASQNVAKYLRTVVLDQSDRKFTHWLAANQKRIDDMDQGALESAARKFYHVSTSDIRSVLLGVRNRFQPTRHTAHA